jgi:HSP20 family protein
MWRPAVRNHAFDWMGERYAPLFDPDHFLGHNAFTFPYRKRNLVNVKEKENLFELEVAVPGFAKNELNVTMENNVLIIKGEKKAKKAGTDEKYIIEQFDRDSFEKRYCLTREIAREQIKARYENGILYVTFTDVPKEEDKPAREVSVV